MNNKVKYVSWVKLTDKYARDYFIDHLLENGVEVEFWDVVALVREPHNEIGELDTNYLRVLQSDYEFENLVQRHENLDAVYVMLITINWNVRFLFQILSKYKCKTAFLAWGANPAIAVSRSQSIVTKLIKEPMGFFRKLFGMGCFSLYKLLGLIKPYNLTFIAGSVLNKGKHFSKKYIQLNSPDYEHFMRSKESADSFCREKYVVFLDINMAYNSDLGREGLKTVDPHNYYLSLNRFFTLVEEQHRVKVVIAAHPKTNPNLNVFDGREVYRLSTAEIVKDAEFVITHHSTSLNYAVLNIKPCIFIYTNEMEELYPNCRVRSIKLFADYLDAPVCNIDNLSPLDKIVIKQPNRLLYDNYRYQFVTSKETENQSSKDIFLREINNN